MFIISLKSFFILQLFPPDFSHSLSEHTNLQESITRIWHIAHKILFGRITDLNILKKHFFLGSLNRLTRKIFPMRKMKIDRK